MSNLSDHDRAAWLRQFPVPATPEELARLATLYGLRLVKQSTRRDEAAWRTLHLWRLTAPDGRQVCRYFSDSPIERYSERVARWRREGR